MSVRRKDPAGSESSRAPNTPRRGSLDMDMTCGMCLEVVLAKECLSDRLFGLLSDCTHCFCLACVRRFRKSSFACPVCQIPSKIYIPSYKWTVDKNVKQVRICEIQDVMMKMPCRFFDKVRGTCPQGSECLYKHENDHPKRWNTAEDERRRALFQERKDALANIPCRYFNRGRGICRRGSECCYKHEEHPVPRNTAEDDERRRALIQERKEALAKIPCLYFNGGPGTCYQGRGWWNMVDDDGREIGEKFPTLTKMLREWEKDQGLEGSPL